MKTLADIHERLNLALTVIKIGFWDWDIHSDEFFWDDQMHELTGLDKTTNVKRNEFFFSKIHPDDIRGAEAKFINILDPNSSKTHFQDNFRFIREGEIRHFHTSGVCFRDASNNPLRILGSTIDKTDQIKAQQKLKDSEERFRTIYEENSDFIYSVNKDLRIEYINHTTPGLKNEDVVGMYMVDFVVPKDKEMVKEVLHKVFETGESKHYHTSFNSQNGIIHYATRVMPRFVGAKVEHVTMISRDVTEELEREKQLIEQTKELERYNQNLEQFAYVSAHDIKAPVTNLDSLIRILDEMDVIKPEGIPVFDKVKTSVQQINKTIRTLNDILHVQSHLNLAKENLAFEDVLNDVLALIEDQLQQSGAELSIDFSACRKVKFPRVHMHSILFNLLSNAIKYAKPNKTPLVRIHSYKEEGNVCLEVEDNGRGIDLEMYGEKIFNLFQRFHLDTDGKGIGLHLVKMIVESYDGKIGIESKPDKGTRFKLTLK